MLYGQAGFDIRFLESRFDIPSNEVCYNVELKSSDEKNWNLAGQNYRLYYDASELAFKSGKSLLGSDYQSFTLVQNVQEVDASNAGGCLGFDSNIGFLNYAIDLLNPSKAGLLLPSGESWLSTTQLCFNIKLEIPNTSKTFDLVWARADLTNAYATSFVEVSQWLSANQTTSAVGQYYFDIGQVCQIEEKKEVYLRAKVFLEGVYDSTLGLMQDHLRQKSCLPLQEPYNRPDFSSFQHIGGGEEKVEATVFQITGPNAIVDWVFLELRDKT